MTIRKAFDTLDHSILVKKREFYGIYGVSGEFLRSCLSNRSQFVSLHNVDSPRENSVCGVPQESVLGLILFNLYIRDIVK